ncbi:Uncharacterised protein [Mycobacteroides abscessus subsp. bolletii]|nr:Uncharacterised protein [Mycobacteroides abscessus subsp. bolletii]
MILRTSRECVCANSSEYDTITIFRSGFSPNAQAGVQIASDCDFPVRGGVLTTSR